MKRNKEKKPKFVDDGRTIASMNVDGMPWYRGESTAPAANADEGSAKDGAPAKGYLPGQERPEPLSKDGQHALMGGVLGAALLIGGIFALAFFLFILFCTKVWFA